MEVIKEQLDSIAFGANVLRISEIDENIEFSHFEKDYIAEYFPKYVYAKIEIENIEKIHYLENRGFNFVETQLKMAKNLSNKYDTSMFDDDYAFVEVKDEKDLSLIYDICDKIFNVDRIYKDPKIDISISKKRYRLYIDKSFRSKEERLFKFIKKRTNDILGINTHILLGNKNILTFIGGILPEYWNTGLAFLQEYFAFNKYIDDEIKKVTTHISLANYNIMKFELQALKFKPIQTYVVLRKIY